MTAQPRRRTPWDWVSHVLRKGACYSGKSQLVVALIIAGTAACGCNEPTSGQIRAAFERHRGNFEELRLLFQEDAKNHRVQMISVASSSETRCRDRCAESSCLDADRWREYSSKMQACGIRRIELHRETPGIYFHMHRAAWDFWAGEFRSRGLVYAPGSPTVTHDHDDAEERVDVGEGWCTFLIIDT
jgi:hypothetical protein